MASAPGSRRWRGSLGLSAPIGVIETELPEVLLLQLVAFRDERGLFVETFNASSFAAAGLPDTFVQDNHSHSTRGVLRGLHFQRRVPQGKLVKPFRGRIFDVAVDVRIGSPHFGRWVGVVLDADAMNALWIPPGFAHGFCALSDEVDVVYKCTGPYDATDESGIIWNDPAVAIDWPVASPIVSARDRALPELRAHSDLPAFDGDSR